MMIKKNLLLLCLGISSMASQSYALDGYHFIAPAIGFLAGNTNWSLGKNNYIGQGDPQFIAKGILFGSMVLSIVPEAIKKIPKITHQSTVKEYREAKLKASLYAIKNILTYMGGYVTGLSTGKALFGPLNT